MASQNKVLANQQNAKASTGPKTQSGKAIASANATRHGILSQELILSNENPQEYEALLQSLINELGAVGTLECTLVERIAVAIWRQRRLVRAERQNIERQNEGGNSLDASSGGSNRQSQVESQTDKKFTVVTLSQLQKAKNIEAMERELHLFLKSSRLSKEEYEKYFPILSKDLPLEDALKSIRESFKKSEEWRLSHPKEHKKESDSNLLVREQIAQLKAKRAAVLKANIASNTESLTRYQAALDNEWYKAMRAFREARQYRLSTLENVENSS